MTLPTPAIAPSTVDVEKQQRGREMRIVLWLPIVIRLVLSLLTRTFFAPDEFYQSLEPAHHAVFGYGYLTWEWVSPSPIRSFTYPALFVPFYYTLRLLRLDHTYALIWAPKLLHGAFATLTDISTFLLAEKTIGPRYAFTALFLSLTSFYNVLALSRTLSNSFETMLTVSALCFWPLAHSSLSIRELRISVVLAAFACLMRPTNAIIWMILGIHLLLSNQRMAPSILANVVPIGLMAIATNVAIDYQYYHRLVFTPLNFMWVNLSGVSLFYGQTPWHYYLTQALPVLCGTALPFCLLGFFQSMRGTFGPEMQRLALVAGLATFTYSMTGHKEWRFLHPLLPIFLISASKIMVDSSHDRFHHRADQRPLLPIRNLYKFIILSLLPVSLYVLFFHGRGQIAVMYYLRGTPPAELRSVGILMPCHSTPWQAFLHRPELEGGRLWTLTCEPPLAHQNLSTYVHQTNYFYDDPVMYLHKFFPPNVSPDFPAITPWPSLVGRRLQIPTDSDSWYHPWPSHLVFFDSLLRQHDPSGNVSVQHILEDKGYEEIWDSGWNGWESDKQRHGSVRVWKWNG